MTLVEVLAAMAILAALLGGFLSIKSNAKRQWRAADRRVRAVEQTDRLLDHWFRKVKDPAKSNGETEAQPDAVPTEIIGSASISLPTAKPWVPAPAQGVLPGPDSLQWQTQTRPSPEAKALGCRLVELSVHDPADRLGPPLLRIPLLVALKPPSGSADDAAEARIIGPEEDEEP